MSRTCSYTKRRPLTGNNRSHSLRATRRRWNLNLQKVTYIDENGKRVTARLSTKAIRTIRKNDRATANSTEAAIA